jgi:hypothetical protein
MSRGRLIGEGSPNELVGALGEYVLEVETESTGYIRTLKGVVVRP